MTFEVIRPFILFPDSVERVLTPEQKKFLEEGGTVGIGFGLVEKAVSDVSQAAKEIDDLMEIIKQTPGNHDAREALFRNVHNLVDLTLRFEAMRYVGTSIEDSRQNY